MLDVVGGQREAQREQRRAAAHRSPSMMMPSIARLPAAAAQRSPVLVSSIAAAGWLAAGPAGAGAESTMSISSEGDRPSIRRAAGSAAEAERTSRTVGVAEGAERSIRFSVEGRASRRRASNHFLYSSARRLKACLGALASE